MASLFAGLTRADSSKLFTVVFTPFLFFFLFSTFLVLNLLSAYLKAREVHFILEHQFIS